MIYRKMKDTDIEGVYEVEVSAFKEPWSYNSLRDELKNRLAKYIVAEEDGKIVGYLGVWHIIDEAHITNVAVHKDFRGRGIGGGLMEALDRQCKE